MEEIRTEIGNEIQHMEKALANRMRRIIAGGSGGSPGGTPMSPPPSDVTNVDLAGLNVIGQVCHDNL